MKFVYLGYDFMLGAVHRLLQDGHELVGIMSFECDNIFNFNKETQSLAEKLNIPFTIARPESQHIENYIDKGAELFLAAGYLYKIPDINNDKAYGLNFHPSYLPAGRGIMPTPYIIMDHPEAAGITIHRLTSHFDQGHIVHREQFTLAEDEDVETYCARITLRGPEIISMVVKDLPEYWNNAQLQNEEEASHFPPPDEALRTINWNGPVDKIDKIGRAFGRYGCLARIEDKLYVIYNLKCWKEPHSLIPGQIATTLSREIIIAAADGFVCIKELQEI